MGGSYSGGASAGASKALDNLAAVAINESLVDDTDVTDDLGTGDIRFKSTYTSELNAGLTAADTLLIQGRDVDGAAFVPFITVTSNNTPTCAIAGTVTGVTQSASDNSTKLATTAYADAAGAGGGATTALSNLAGVAINTSLISDTDVTDDLGTGDIRWKSVYPSEINSGLTAADTLLVQGYDVDGAVNVPFITITSNNTPTCALAGTVTGVTQSPSDNSTKLATTAYADAAGGGGGGITWTEVTGTTQAAAVDNGYIANNGSQVVVTLPTTAAVGKVVRVAGKGSGGWKIAQNASELIHFLGSVTTTGTGGYLASTTSFDAVELLCTVADTEWEVISVVGNVTIV
jgi:hypothetical protein